MSGLRADKMPTGTVCGPCGRGRHRFLHPHSYMPAGYWFEDDGCPCCHSHIEGEPPLGAGTPDEEEQ